MHRAFYAEGERSEAATCERPDGGIEGFGAPSTSRVRRALRSGSSAPPPHRRQLVQPPFLRSFFLFFRSPISPSTVSAAQPKPPQNPFQGLRHLRSPLPQALPRPGIRQRLLGELFARERRHAPQEQQLIGGVGRGRRRPRGPGRRGRRDERRRRPGPARIHQQRGVVLQQPHRHRRQRLLGPALRGSLGRGQGLRARQAEPLEAAGRPQGDGDDDLRVPQGRALDRQVPGRVRRRGEGAHRHGGLRRRRPAGEAAPRGQGVLRGARRCRGGGAAAALPGQPPRAFDRAPRRQARERLRGRRRPRPPRRLWPHAEPEAGARDLAGGDRRVHGPGDRRAPTRRRRDFGRRVAGFDRRLRREGGRVGPGSDALRAADWCALRFFFPGVEK